MNNTEIDFTTVQSDELIEYISFKDEYPKEAELAFAEFCYRFQSDVLKKAEIYSSKYGHSEVIAEDIMNCTFNKVWKYPKFNKNKAKSKNIDTAIKIYLYKIAYNELMKYGYKDTCVEPEQEDLEIIENIEELIDITTEDKESKRELRIRLEILEKAMLGLSEKHKIIFLTYKAYENSGKNIPRSVSRKLQKQLNLSTSTIRVYKKNAISHINNYLKNLNGTK